MLPGDAIISHCSLGEGMPVVHSNAHYVLLYSTRQGKSFLPVRGESSRTLFCGKKPPDSTRVLMGYGQSWVYRFVSRCLGSSDRPTPLFQSRSLTSFLIGTRGMEHRPLEPTGLADAVPERQGGNVAVRRPSRARWLWSACSLPASRCLCVPARSPG